MAIGEYIDGHNQNPNSFIWTAKATDIVERVTRGRAVLNKWRPTLALSPLRRNAGFSNCIVVCLPNGSRP